MVASPKLGRGGGGKGFRCSRKRERIIHCRARRACRDYRDAIAAEGSRHQGGREHLAYLELSEARYRADLLDGLHSIGESKHLPGEGLGLGLAEELLQRGGRRENGLERAELAKDPITVLNAPDAREEQSRSRELEIDGAFGKGLRSELIRPLLPRVEIGQDLLDLDAGRLRELALRDVAELGEHLGQGITGRDPRLRHLHLIRPELSFLYENRGELVLGIVGRGEQDLAVAEIDRLLQRSALELERARYRSPMQLDEEVERGFPAQIPAFSVFHQTCLRNPLSAGCEAEEDGGTSTTTLNNTTKSALALGTSCRTHHRCPGDKEVSTGVDTLM